MFRWVHYAEEASVYVAKCVLRSRHGAERDLGTKCFLLQVFFSGLEQRLGVRSDFGCTSRSNGEGTDRGCNHSELALSADTEDQADRPSETDKSS